MKDFQELLEQVESDSLFTTDTERSLALVALIPQELREYTLAVALERLLLLRRMRGGIPVARKDNIDPAERAVRKKKPVDLLRDAGYTFGDVRTWCFANGIDVNERGTISYRICQMFLEAVKDA